MGDEIELLTDMVRIQSPSGKEGELAHFLLSEMNHRGISAHIDSVGNVIGQTGEGKREILLLGHIDTAPGYVEVKKEGRKLFGRGTVDAKGAFSAFLVAASQIKEFHRKKIIIIGAVEEENTSSLGSRNLLHKYKPHYVIIGEPSGWENITLGYKGRILLRYTLEKPMGHSAGPIKSACEEAVDFWRNLKEYAEQYNHEKGAFETLDLSLQHFNSYSDGLFQRVEETTSVRIPLGLEIKSLKERIEEVKRDGRVTFYGEEKAYKGDKNNPLIKTFLKVIRDKGGNPKFKLKTGTSDMNVVAPYWKCPIVAYGPGDSRLDHTPYECIDLYDYRKSIEVLTAVLEIL